MKKYISYSEINRLHQDGMGLRNIEAEHIGINGLKVKEGDFGYLFIYSSSVNNSDFNGTKFKEVTVEDSVIKNTSFENTEIELTLIENTTFLNCNFSNSSFKDVWFINCSFQNCLFNNSNFEDCAMKFSNFTFSSMEGVNFKNVFFKESIGNGREIKSLQIGRCLVNYGFGILNIGCESHSYEEWMKFSDKEILKMGYDVGLKWWKENKRVVFELIEREMNESK